MEGLVPTIPYYVIVLLWMARTAFFAFVCSILVWAGIRILDAARFYIHERQKIGESGISIGLFIGGFFICIGLVIHGASTLPILVGASPALTVFAPTRLLLLVAGFLLSLLVGIILFILVDRLTPRIPFVKMGQEPVGAGVYMFGYLIFFGLIVHAALTTPL